MSFVLITAAAALQFLALLVLRKQKTFVLHWVVSIAFLFVHFWVLPKLIIDSTGVLDQECGMPVMGFYFVFYIFGAVATIISTAFGYMLWWNTKMKRK